MHREPPSRRNCARSAALGSTGSRSPYARRSPADRRRFPRFLTSRQSPALRPRLPRLLLRGSLRYVRPALIVVTNIVPAERGTTPASMSTKEAVAAMTNDVTVATPLPSGPRPFAAWAVVGRRPVADQEPRSRRSMCARAARLEVNPGRFAARQAGRDEALAPLPRRSRQAKPPIAAAQKQHKRALAAAAAAPAPSYSSSPLVQVVTLPPLTITRTS